MASWKYDKRPLNDAPFVYFCTELVSIEEEEDGINVSDAVKYGNNKNSDNNNNDNDKNKNKNNENFEGKMQSIYSYAKKVLDALDIKWGPAHLGNYANYARYDLKFMLA